MALTSFLKLFSFVANLFFLPFRLLFNIEIVQGIYFGNVLIYLMILILVVFIFTRPLRK